MRETGTGNATPPCLLRGDITGIWMQRERRRRGRGEGKYAQLSFWMIAAVLGVVVLRGKVSCLKASVWMCPGID